MPSSRHWLEFGLAVHRRQHHDQRRSIVIALAQVTGQRETVDFRHGGIDQSEIERRSVSIGPIDEFQRQGGMGNRLGPQSQAPECAGQNGGAGLAVVDDQDALACQPWRHIGEYLFSTSGARSG